MLQSDADSVCLICHNKLNRGAGGSRELQCTHTFHKEVTHTNTQEDREWSVSINNKMTNHCEFTHGQIKDKEKSNTQKHCK